MDRILQFVADGSPGGGTTHVRQLVTGLRSQFEVAVLTQLDSSLYRSSNSSGLPTFGGDFFSGLLSRVNPRCVHSVRSAIRAFQPDLVHCHGGRAAFYQSFLPRNCRTVYTAHGLHYSRKPRWSSRTLGRLGERWACRKVDRVIYVSRHDAGVAQTDRLLPRSTSARVIYPSIAPNAHQQAHCDDRPFTVGFIGRMVEQKNPLLFVEVMNQLPGVAGVCGGGGPLLDAVKKACHCDQFSSRLEITGDLEHVETLRLLCRLDVLVMTSLWEGLPILVLEAMYAGVPVVSVPVGGVPELIEHGRTGLLSRRYHAEELAALVRQLQNDPKQRAAISAAAHNQVKERFLESQMIADIAELYREVLSQPQERTPRSQREAQMANRG
jgi:glycosyltransferase involved in cell wall biosynthesis